MNIAIYARPWSLSYFTFLGQAAFPGARRYLMSDFRGLAELDLSAPLTRRMQQRPPRVTWPDWVGIDDEYQILDRNYVLRSKPIDYSRRLASSVAWAIEETLDEVKPDGILAPSGDNYVLDLIGRYGAARGVPVCGLIPCPLRGYARATIRGEYAAFREPSEEEVASALAGIRDPEFKPLDMTDWLQMYGSYVTLTRAIREKPKPYVFPVISKLKKDPYNYHYFASATTNVSIWSQGLLIDRNFDAGWRARVQAHRGPIVYFPLPAYPEASTDYHVASLDLIDFQSLLFDVLERYAADPDLLVLLKEHPGMMGARPPGFYDALKTYSNAVLVSGQVASLEMIDASQTLLTWTGTGGLEAIVRGKPVVTLGRPYYSHGPAFFEIERRDGMSALTATTRAAATAAVPADAPEQAVRTVLRSCFPGEFRQLGFDARGEAGRQEARELGENIARHWQAWAAAFPAAFSTHVAGLPTAPGPHA